MPNNFNQIPEELKVLPQWVVWRYEDIGSLKPTKVPYDPKAINVHASVTDPNTWSAFQEASTRYKIGGFDGIGFVFTDGDPFTFVDLDNTTKLPNGQPNPNHHIDLERQIKIFREFDSYSEVSPGGFGLHVIVKGKVPVGRKRSFIEIYSSGRYATFTGDVYHNATINYRQDVLTQLWEQMGNVPATYTFSGNDKELYTDEQVTNKALNAANGDKFKALLEGNWQTLYPSQSEADFAFVDIVAFYTQNKKQIERIFKASPLGQRDKARRSDYVNKMIMDSFDRQLPPIDFDGFKNALDLKIAQQKTSPQLDLPMAMPKQQGAGSSIVIPPGLLGELAQFIYQAAPRSVPEVALAGSIGLLAGICGRAYNVSGTGLNQYVLLIANTGIGKEAMASGIDRLMNTIRAQVPTSGSFIGPAEIGSGQALVKHLNENPCFVSILGEFGLRLQAMSNPVGNSVEIHLRRMLLDLYNKSGHGQVFRPTIYSDRSKNIGATNAPAFTILGESTPDKFYGALNEDMIAEGLLPRFMLIEYTGPRPPSNKNHLQVQPSFQLIEKFASLVANCEVIMHAKKVIDIPANPEAETILDDFDKHCDAQINSTSKDIIKQLWNRAHMKALKTSALIAVGVNMSNPIIMPEYVNWSINMVQSDIRALSAKFESGEIGSHSFENKQFDEVIKHIKSYYGMGYEKLKGYGVNETMYNARIISYGYLNRRLLPVACFRQDRLGATNAVKRTIQTLLDSDKLREVGRLEMANRFGSTQRAFIVSDLTILA